MYPPSTYFVSVEYSRRANFSFVINPPGTALELLSVVGIDQASPYKIPAPGALRIPSFNRGYHGQRQDVDTASPGTIYLQPAGLPS